MIVRNASRRSTRGFSLVEVTLALGIAGFCLVSLFGLLPIGINSNQNSVEQTIAASAASSVVSDLRSTAVVAGTTTRSPQFGIPLPAANSGSSNAQQYTLFLRDDGTLAVPAGTSLASTAWPGTDANQGENPQYRVTLNFVVPAAELRGATTVRVLVTWPVTADGKASQLPTHATGSFETTTALDRN